MAQVDQQTMAFKPKYVKHLRLFVKDANNPTRARIAFCSEAERDKWLRGWQTTPIADAMALRVHKTKFRVGSYA